MIYKLRQSRYHFPELGSLSILAQDEYLSTLPQQGHWCLIRRKFSFDTKFEFFCFNIINLTRELQNC